MKKDQRFYWRGWNAALDQTRAQVCEIPDHIPLVPGHEAVLGVVRWMIDELYRNEDQLKLATNPELARKYGMSLRSVINWKRAGCDFSSRRRVMAFARTRRSLPSGFKQRFVESCGVHNDASPGALRFHSLGKPQLSR